MIKKNRAPDARNLRAIDEMKSPNIITAIVRVVGIRPLARALGVSPATTRIWAVNGRLPYTEYAGKTNFSDSIVTIAAEYGMNITKKDLLFPLIPKKPI